MPEKQIKPKDLTGEEMLFQQIYPVNQAHLHKLGTDADQCPCEPEFRRIEDTNYTQIIHNFIQ